MTIRTSARSIAERADAVFRSFPGFLSPIARDAETPAAWTEPWVAMRLQL
jgi:hypothetical protein